MKILPPLFLLLMTAVLVSCASRSQQPDAADRVLAGRVFVIGNEPFTRVALETSDSTMVVLQCSKEDELQLRKNQGKTARVTFDGETTTEHGREVHVTSVDIKSK